MPDAAPRPSSSQDNPPWLAHDPNGAAAGAEDLGGYIPVALPTTPPTITMVLVGLIVAVFAIGLVVGQDNMVLLGAKINEPILRGGQYYRLVSVMFLHANLMHLFFNTYALWVIGRDVERFYGHLRFAAIFFLGGLSASVASLALTPGPAVGASGAVFAVFAAEMVLLYRNRGLFGEAARQRLRSLVMLLVLNAAIGFAGAGIIDNWAHIGGFLGGAVVSWLVVPTYRVAPPEGTEGSAQLAEAASGVNLALLTVLWLALVAVAVAWLQTRAG
jgi:rhomboid protease GluP